MDNQASSPTDAISFETELDEDVAAVLPEGCQVLSVRPSGRSLWVTTSRVEVKLEDGSINVFFMKGSPAPYAYNMMKGAFEAESTLYEFVPELVPRPVAYGTYKSRPDFHFYLCEFVDMLDDVPTPQAWASAVASLHKRSMGKSLAGAFGFPLTTYMTAVPVCNVWNSSWEMAWSQQMGSLLDKTVMLPGYNEEFAHLKETYLNVVVPRYLRPLESDGRKVSACLIHSDLWPGNIKLRKGSEAVCIFDACPSWGHHEADLAICRNPRYRLGKAYIEEYQEHMPISEPVEDFEARNAVYAMKYHVLLTLLYPDEPKFLRIATDEMRSLVNMASCDPRPGTTQHMI
ncbi:Fructosamine kinase-domain-containing protein [Xylariomycetidae sp. FL0641]|nr:Fructosamine kinase-domain-containing protein [Xylariomycetidae sp. FL0641]